MVALDPSAPSPEEQVTQAITKMRYMQVVNSGHDKMVALDPSAPSPEEQVTQAITKMRYMQVG